VKLWREFLPFLLGLVLIFGMLFAAYQHGVDVTEAEWSAKWSKRDAKDQLAAATEEVAAREKEQARQQSINKVIQYGQKTIDRAVADAAADRTSYDSMRRTINELTGKLSTSQASSDTCTANASHAAARAALVFAHVLKRADQRAGELAETADQTRARGLMCNGAYISLGKN
jgi:predicted membrane-bound mannosyltransferase